MCPNLAHYAQIYSLRLNLWFSDYLTALKTALDTFDLKNLHSFRKLPALPCPGLSLVIYSEQNCIGDDVQPLVATATLN